MIKNTDNSWAYDTPDTVLITVCELAHLNLIATVTTLGGSYYSHPHFTDKKTEAERMHTADPQFEPWFQRPHP